MQIKGIHHIKLTVSSLEKSKYFYQDLPNFKIVAEHDDFVMFYTGSFYLGLTSHKNKAEGKFNEQMIGLDHVSFEVGAMSDLEEAIKFFADKKIPHGKIEKLSNNVYTLVFRDPDNIQLELSCREK